MEDIILKIGDTEYNIKFSKSNHANISVNDKIYSIELLKKIHDNVFSFSVNQRLVQVELDFDKQGDLTIALDGYYYTIGITNSTKQLLEKFILSSAAFTSGAKILKAPMPGMVIKSFVEVGSLVMEGDKLIIIEAMKMENVLKSPITGTVKLLAAREGTPVNKDEILLEIEPIVAEAVAP